MLSAVLPLRLCLAFHPLHPQHPHLGLRKALCWAHAWLTHPHLSSTASSQARMRCAPGSIATKVRRNSPTLRGSAYWQREICHARLHKVAEPSYHLTAHHTVKLMHAPGAAREGGGKECVAHWALQSGHASGSCQGQYSSPCNRPSPAREFVAALTCSELTCMWCQCLEVHRRQSWRQLVHAENIH